MTSTVERMRSRFSGEEASHASSSDVVAACARLLGGGEDAVEFLVSVAARVDNPCWLPQDACATWWRAASGAWWLQRRVL